MDSMNINELIVFFYFRMGLFPYSTRTLFFDNTINTVILCDVFLFFVFFLNDHYNTDHCTGRETEKIPYSRGVEEGLWPNIELTIKKK